MSLSSGKPRESDGHIHERERAKNGQIVCSWCRTDWPCRYVAVNPRLHNVADLERIAELEESLSREKADRKEAEDIAQRATSALSEREAEVERAGQLLAAAVTMIAQRYDVSPEEARKAIEIMLQLQDRDAARKEREDG